MTNVCASIFNTSRYGDAYVEWEIGSFWKEYRSFHRSKTVFVIYFINIEKMVQDGTRPNKVLSSRSWQTFSLLSWMYLYSDIDIHVKCHELYWSRFKTNLPSNVVHITSNNYIVRQLRENGPGWNSTRESKKGKRKEVTKITDLITSSFMEYVSNYQRQNL